MTIKTGITVYRLPALSAFLWSLNSHQGQVLPVIFHFLCNVSVFSAPPYDASEF